MEGKGTERAARILAVTHPGVSAIQCDAQEVGVYQGVKERFAAVRIETAQPLGLFDRQPQARHFEEFGAQAFDGVLHETSLSD